MRSRADEKLIPQECSLALLPYECSLYMNLCAVFLNMVAIKKPTQDLP